MTETDDVGVFSDAAALGAPVLAQIVEGTADGIFLCDAERRWVYVNTAACQPRTLALAICGPTAEDLIRLNQALRSGRLLPRGRRPIVDAALTYLELSLS